MSKSNTWRSRRSFGPAVIHEDGGSLRAICTWCVFRVGDTCTHVRPSRKIPDSENTPEWCEMREAMLRDTEEFLVDTEERQSGEKAIHRDGTSSPVRDSQPIEGEAGPCPPKTGPS